MCELLFFYGQIVATIIFMTFRGLMPQQFRVKQKAIAKNNAVTVGTHQTDFLEAKAIDIRHYMSFVAPNFVSSCLYQFYQPEVVDEKAMRVFNLINILQTLQNVFMMFIMFAPKDIACWKIIAQPANRILAIACYFLIPIASWLVTLTHVGVVHSSVQGPWIICYNLMSVGIVLDFFTKEFEASGGKIFPCQAVDEDESF